MSTLNFLTWAFNAQVRNPAELSVLLIVANSADQDGKLTISRKKLADRTKIQANKLDQVICDLEEGGFVEVFDPHDWSKIGICLKVNGQ